MVLRESQVRQRPDVEVILAEHEDKNPNGEIVDLCRYIHFLETRMAGVKTGLAKSIEAVERKDIHTVISHVRMTVPFYEELTGNSAPPVKLSLVGLWGL